MLLFVKLEAGNQKVADDLRQSLGRQGLADHVSLSELAGACWEEPLGLLLRAALGLQSRAGARKAIYCRAFVVYHSSRIEFEYLEVEGTRDSFQVRATTCTKALERT